MKKFKSVILKIFSPCLPLIILFCIISAALLTCVFVNGYEQSVIACVSYAFSAYTLVAVSLKIPETVKKCKEILHSNRYTKRYLTEADHRAKISLYSGLCIHLIYSVFKLVSGIYYSSVWLGAEAVYHTILGVIQLLMVRSENKEDQENLNKWQIYRTCGILMLLLNSAISAFVVMTVFQNKSYVYSGIVIYATAAYTFYRLITAFVHIGKFRKRNQPILFASKYLNLSAAFMSLFALQTAMLTQFGDETINSRVMNALTGCFVIFSVIYIAVSMIIRATKEIKKLKI